MSALAHSHRSNRLLAALASDIRGALERDMHEAMLAQGTVLFEPGAPIERIYFPQTGMISLLVVTRDGTMLETSTIGREGAVGLHRGLGDRRSFTRATVQIAGTFSVIDATRFHQAALRHGPVRDLIAEYTERLWIEAQQTAACNAIHDASSRLCRRLLQSADRIESDHLPLTQEFLSYMLGVRRTTLTLLARALQQRRAIEYTRGKIRIVDRVLLEASACECYQVIHREERAWRTGAKA
ncbi:MAG TPA: Crp/Fnr family transcriptional regulator [Pseudolabrys sp.]